MLYEVITASHAMEDETLQTLMGGLVISVKSYTAGHHYINVALDEVVIFLRKGHILLLCEPADSEEP